jgi:hypothetical protein
MRIIKPALLIALQLLLFAGLEAQTNVLSQPTVNKLLNKAFSQLVTGKTGSNELASYASMDVVDGSMTLKGVIPLRKNNDSVGKVTFLSLQAQGDLISESYTVLFQNSALNTGVLVNAEINFQVGGRGLSYLGSDETNFLYKKNLLRQYRTESLKKIDLRIKQVH